MARVGTGRNHTLSAHQCTRPDTDHADPWRCPDCGTLWEPLPKQPAEHVDHQTDTQEQTETPPWAQQPLSRGSVVAGVVMGTIVGLALLLQDQQPVLVAVLGSLALVIVACWFWLVVRK